jgi:hypothetical protein
MADMLTGTLQRKHQQKAPSVTMTARLSVENVTFSVALHARCAGEIARLGLHNQTSSAFTRFT